MLSEYPRKMMHVVEQTQIAYQEFTQLWVLGSWVFSLILSQDESKLLLFCCSKILYIHSTTKYKFIQWQLLNDAVVYPVKITFLNFQQLVLCFRQLHNTDSHY